MSEKPGASPATRGEAKQRAGCRRRSAAGWQPEVELKFAAPAATLEALLALPPLARARGADAPPRSLESTYYDSPGHDLRRAGVALRVRRDGDRFVQTVKVAAPGGNPHARLEREEPIAAPPARPRLPADALPPGLAHLAAGPWQPLFATRVRRRVLEAVSGVARIEVAIDSGRVEAGAGSSPISEIELELRQGTLGDLYDLAAVLHRLRPLAVETRTKSERGYALAGGAPPAWRKAGALEIDVATTLDEAIGRAMAHGFDHWLANQAAALDGRDGEGVHQMRVALRRLRAAFGLFAPWLPPAPARALRREAAWLARRLGRARDLDVLRADVLAPVRRALPADGDLALLDEKLRQRAAAAYGALARAASSPRYTDLVLAMGRWVARGGWRRDGAGEALARPLAGEAAAVLDALHGKLLAGGRDFEAMTPAGRHRLRLAVKRLRYALQFTGGAWGGARPWLLALSRLQDALGEARDAALAEGQIAAALARSGGGRRRLARASGLVAGWWLARREEQEERARELWRAFAALQPCWRRDGLTSAGGRGRAPSAAAGRPAGG